MTRIREGHDLMHSEFDHHDFPHKTASIRRSRTDHWPPGSVTAGYRESRPEPRRAADREYVTVTGVAGDISDRGVGDYVRTGFRRVTRHPFSLSHRVLNRPLSIFAYDPLIPSGIPDGPVVAITNRLNN